ncbi:MAG: VTT domain-containing protein [Gemmatimonadetes bacterium]|nr:VTT domain-containing protein [Gemmatimonadota bacterium]
MSLLRKIFGVFIYRLGDRRWDLFLRATAVAALVGIPVALAFPGLIPLVWLAVMTPPFNGPLSPVMPTSYEPLLIEAAKHAAPVAVAAVALPGVLYAEYVNWHAYAWALNLQRFAAMRERPWIRRSVAAFGRSPFWTVAVFAFTPLPYWVARCLAIMRGYPLPRYYAATAVGRFPRYLLYACFGSVVHVPTWILIGIIVVPASIAIGLSLARRERAPEPVSDRLVPADR